MRLESQSVGEGRTKQKKLKTRKEKTYRDVECNVTNAQNGSAAVPSQMRCPTTTQDLGIGVLVSTEYDDNVLLTNKLKPNP